MPDWPLPDLGSRITLMNLATYGEGGVADQRMQEGGAVAAAAWPVAATALFYPVVVYRPMTITQFMWWNGTITTAPTVDCGLYRPDGTRLVSTGPVTQSGASVPQKQACTSTAVPIGRYLIAMCVSGTGSQFNQVAVSAAALNFVGCKQVASVASSTLPTSVTFAAIGSGYVPIFQGLTMPIGASVV